MSAQWILHISAFMDRSTRIFTKKNSYMNGWLGNWIPFPKQNVQLEWIEMFILNSDEKKTASLSGGVWYIPIVILSKRISSNSSQPTFYDRAKRAKKRESFLRILSYIIILFFFVSFPHESGRVHVKARWRARVLWRHTHAYAYMYKS